MSQGNSLVTSSDLAAGVARGIFYPNGPVPDGSRCLVWSEVEALVSCFLVSQTPGLLPTFDEARTHSSVAPRVYNASAVQINVDFIDQFGGVTASYGVPPGGTVTGVVTVAAKTARISYLGNTVVIPVVAGQYNVGVGADNIPVITPL